MQPVINFIERNIHGAWEIHGALGYRQYYDYTEAEAKRLYKQEYYKTQGQFVCCRTEKQVADLQKQLLK